MSAVCECCGQTLPNKLDLRGVVLSYTKYKIVEAVHSAGKHGVRTDRLIMKVYGDDVDGGPDNASVTIHVHICQINKKLTKVGLRVKGEHTGNSVHGFYRLVDVV